MIPMLQSDESLVKLVRANLPFKPYATNNFQTGLYPMQKDKALASKYIQLNAPNTRSVICIDVDRDVGVVDDYKLPCPNFVCYNPSNGHAHIFYVLENPVHLNPNSSSKAQSFANDVEMLLTWAWKGDWNYNHLVSKNPFSPSWNVAWTNLHPYRLDELRDWFDLEDLRTAATQKTVALTELKQSGDGRNCTLFDTLRHWAYKEIHHLPEGEDWNAHVFEKAQKINNRFPSQLGLREVLSVSKSVANWTMEHMGSEENKMAWNAETTRKSAEVRHAHREERIQRASQLYIEGVTTMNDVAKVMGCSLRSVKTYIKIAKERQNEN